MEETKNEAYVAVPKTAFYLKATRWLQKDLQGYKGLWKNSFLY